MNRPRAVKGGGGGGGTGSIFPGYVPLASQNPNPSIVYSVVNYGLLGKYVIFAIPTHFHFLFMYVPYIE